MTGDEAITVISERIADLEHQILAKDARVSELDRQLAAMSRSRDFSYREACRLEQRFTVWKAYAIALQRLYDNGGPLMEPALAREVEELRERCE